MKLLQKLRTFFVLAFVLSILTAASLGSCESKSNADDNKESKDHPAADSAKKADHPKAESEHPKKDSTKVEN
ncbi:MAG: hypothetical protein WD824_05460 [Cyclobacteriaceae bacterium]